MGGPESLLLFLPNPSTRILETIIHLYVAKHNLDISCSVTRTYEEVLASREPFKRPILLSVSCLVYIPMLSFQIWEILV